MIIKRVRGTSSCIFLSPPWPIHYDRTNSINVNQITSIYCIIGDENELITLCSIEPFTNDSSNKKYCVNCGDLATQLTYFDVDGTTTVERYCDRCADLVKFPA